MTETGAPPPSSSGNSAERAKLIAERSRNDTARETQGIIRNTEDRPQQRPLQITSERLPPRTENLASPQRLEGQVTEVRADTARIQTTEGEIKVRIPEGVKLTAGQSVTIDIPPETRSGDQITLRIAPQRPVDAPLPPPRPDFPPLKAGDVVVATTAPVAAPVATSPDTARVTPVADQPAAPAPVSYAARITAVNFPAAEKIDFPLQDSLTRFSLQPQAPIENWLTTDIRTTLPPPAMPPNMPMPITQDDNVLTQIAQFNTATADPGARQTAAFPASLTLTDSAFSTLSENAPALFPGAAAVQSLMKAIPAAQPAANITNFLQIQVLGLIPPNTPPAEAQKLMDQFLSPPENKTAFAGPQNSPIPPASAPLKPEVTPQTPPAAAPVMATVIGTGNTGQTLVTVPAPMAEAGQNLLHIQTPVTVDPGTQMQIMITPLTVENMQNTPDLLSKLPSEMAQQISTAKPALPAAALPPPMGFPALAPTWPALQESLDVLKQTAPQTAQAVQNTLPNASPRMVSTALFFLAALKLGGIDSWLGDKNIDSLKKSGKSGLTERLAGDFRNIASQASETLSGQWKAITLPLLHDGQINNLQFFVRSEDGQKEDQEDGEENNRTRFILNLELSKIGPLQLDGYLTSENLDLIIRTDHRMDSDNRQDLMRIYSDALDLIQLKGGLSFQSKPENWVNILARETKDGFFI